MASRGTSLAVVLLFGCALAVCNAQCRPACMNNGQCLAMEGKPGEFFCSCAEGWFGPGCMAKYAKCGDGELVCYNGGQCARGSNPDDYVCQCPSTWTDPNCRTSVTQCANATDLVCHNGGECLTDDIGSYCKCPPSVRGRTCNFRVQECTAGKGMYCMNEGTCQPDGSCLCKEPFFGLHCQNNARDPNADQIPDGSLPGWAIALIVIACVAAVALAGLAAFLIVREKKGRPYFQRYPDPSGMTTAL